MEDSDEGCCIICCCNLQAANQKPLSLSSSSSSDPSLLFKQFCEKFLAIQQPTLRRGPLLRRVSVCPNCSRNVGSVLDTKSRMEEVEARVEELQLQVIQELKELKGYVDLLGVQLGKIQRSVKKKEANGGGNGLDSSTTGDLKDVGSDGGIIGSKRKRPRRSSGKGDANAKQIIDVQLVRNRIANVTSSFFSFQSKLNQKLSSHHDWDPDVQPNPPEPFRWGSNECGRSPKKLKTNRHRDDPRNKERWDTEEPESSDSGSYYHQGSHSCAASSISPDSPTPDTGPPEKIKRRIILIKKVNSEPEPPPDAEMACASNINEGVDETEDKNEEQVTYQLCEKSGIIKQTGKQKWREMEISGKELKQDFRIKIKNFHLKHSKQIMYYCVHGAPKEACPVRLKVVKLGNGVSTTYRNNYDHDNHRGKPLDVVGLTEDQKGFVVNCIEKGVGKCQGILQSFRHHGIIPEPQQLKLQNFLQRRRRKHLGKVVVELKEVGSTAAEAPDPASASQTTTSSSSAHQTVESNLSVSR